MEKYNGSLSRLVRDVAIAVLPFVIVSVIALSVVLRERFFPLHKADVKTGETVLVGEKKADALPGDILVRSNTEALIAKASDNVPGAADAVRNVPSLAHEKKYELRFRPVPRNVKSARIEIELTKQPPRFKPPRQGDLGLEKLKRGLDLRRQPVKYPARAMI